MSTFIDRLLELPLFHGVSRATLQNVAETTPLQFAKYPNGNRFIQESEQCGSLLFLLGGSVRVKWSSRRLKVSVTHTLDAPNVLGVDSLFGLSNANIYDVTAMGDCSVLEFPKAEYLKLVKRDDVFLINILNYLSRNFQSTQHTMAHIGEMGIEQRLALLVSIYTTQNARDITLTYRQGDLMRLLGCRRGSLLTAIQRLETEGIVTRADAGIIKIPSRRELMDLLNDKNA